MIACFVRLGLRRAEAANPHLDDVGWSAGTVTVHGKGTPSISFPRRSTSALTCTGLVGQAVEDGLSGRGDLRVGGECLPGDGDFDLAQWS